MARLPRKRPVRGKRPPMTMLPTPKRRKRTKNPFGKITYIDPKTGKDVKGRVGRPTIGPAPANPPKRKRPVRGKKPPITMLPTPKPTKPRKPRKGRGRIGPNRPLRKLGRGMARMVK